MSLLADKKILLGITGSIAAYKVADWVRSLRREGCDVTVVMTRSATQFITPLTMAALSANKVHVSMFEQEGAENIPHINLARECDIVLVAPATAQTIGRLAHGLADDLLSTVVLAAAQKPVLICPAMNSKMFEHPATQANIKTIQSYGYRIIEPGCGEMACGESGPGRLVEWESVRQAILATSVPQDLKDKSILVTAGPTREAFDPARFISNRSSGKMGYAVAAAAAQRGADVTLISGPTSLPVPDGIKFERVNTAQEMLEAVQPHAQEMNVIVKSAAVSDYRPAQSSDKKVKKGQATLNLELTANDDILKGLGEQKKAGAISAMLVGFAAESHDHLAEGSRKLQEKNLDLIVVNDIGGSETGFEVDTNRVIMLDKDGTREDLPLLSKEETAHRIWDKIDRLLSGKR